MRTALGKHDLAERERRAKVIHAEGELQASEKLLRYLQTLTTIAADKNSTIVFPLPIDLIGALLERLGMPRER